MVPVDRVGDDDGNGSVRTRLLEWFLLTGRRHHVTLVTVVVVFAVVVVVAVSGLAPFDRVQPLYYVYGGLISGNLTVVTVVVAINQLLLSRELYTPDEMEEKIDGVVDYRDDIRAAVGRTPPVEPLGFLRLLVENSRQEAQALGGLAVTEAQQDLRDPVDTLVTDLTRKSDEIDRYLQESEPSTFRVLSATLATNFSAEVRELRRIRFEHGERLPDDVRVAIDNLVHYLTAIDVARQYFKSIYIQEELASLSRQLFYVGLAALVVVTTGLLLLTTSERASVRSPMLAVVVAAVVTVGLSPISLLFAFIVRVATVSERTVAIMPFTTPRQER